MTSPLDRILAEDYLADLAERSLDDMRAMRTESQQIENDLSYVRRLAHGRIDLVGGEIERRRRGAPPPDASQMVEDLPTLLAERGAASGLPRPPQALGPSPAAGDLLAELDAAATTDQLVGVVEVDDDALNALLDRLQGFETRISEQRRAVQHVVDTVQAEIARRYRTGEASVDSLLG